LVFHGLPDLLLVRRWARRRADLVTGRLRRLAHGFFFPRATALDARDLGPCSAAQPAAARTGIVVIASECLEFRRDSTRIERVEAIGAVVVTYLKRCARRAISGVLTVRDVLPRGRETLRRFFADLRRHGGSVP